VERGWGQAKAAERKIARLKVKERCLAEGIKSRRRVLTRVGKGALALQPEVRGHKAV